MIQNIIQGGATGTGNLQIVLTPALEPKGVLVLGAQYQNGTNQVSSVEVNGDPLGVLNNNPVLKTTGEAMAAYGYFLGFGIPNEELTIDILVSGSATKRFVAFVIGGDDNLEIVSARGNASDSQANPETVNQNQSQRTCLGYLGFMSGTTVVEAITPRTGWIDGAAGGTVDHGTACSGFYMLEETTTDPAVTIGYDCIAEDVAMMAALIATSAAVHRFASTH